VTSAADVNANVIFGAVIDDAMGEEIRVTVIATGFGAGRRRRRASAESQVAVPSSSSEQAENGLDVPSFLRGE
jgi:cell division protein FtsZ